MADSSLLRLALLCSCSATFLASAWAQGVKVNQPFASQSSGDVDQFVLTPDGAQVLYLADQENDDVTELFGAPVDGGSASARLSAPLPAGAEVRAFSWAASRGTRPIVVSPLGDWMAYLTMNEVPGRLRLYSVELDDPSSPILIQQGFFPGSLLEARIAQAQQRIVYRAAVVNGAARIRLFSAPLDGSAAPVQLNAPIDDRDVDGFFLGPDGALAYYLSDDSATTTQLWRRPIDASTAPMLVSEPFAGDGIVHGFELGPDGTRIVYSAEESGVVRLFGRPSDASAPAVQLNDGDLEFAGQGAFPISPDGARVVYREWEAFGDEHHGLFSVPLDRSSPPVRLNSATACPDVQDYWISPDSQWVVFRGDEQNGRDCLYSAPLDGSAPATRLHDLLPAFATLDFSGQISADSTRVFFTADAVVDQRRDLFGAPIDGSLAPVRIDPAGQPATSVHHWFVGPSPAAQRVVFASDPEFDEAYELFSAPLDGSQPALQLTPQPLLFGNPGSFQELALTPDGSRAVYVHDPIETQVYEAWSVPLDGSHLPRRLNTPLHGGPVLGDVFGYEFAAGGRRIYTARPSLPGITAIYGADPARLPRVVPLAPDPGPGYSAGAFLLSSDRATVYFRASLADGQGHVLAAPTDASTPPVDISPPGNVMSLLALNSSNGWVLCRRSDGLLARASAAGSFLLTSTPAKDDALTHGNRVVYLTEPEYPLFRQDLFTLTAAGGFPVPLHPDLPLESSVFSFRISLDGLRVLFVANDGPGGINQLYRAPIFGGSSPVVLSAPGQSVSSALRLTPDGLGVAYLTNSGSTIHGVAIGGGAPIQLSGPMGPGGRPQSDFDFSNGTPYLVYRADAETNEVYELYSLRIGEPAPVKISGTMGVGGDVTDFRISPDGGRVVYRADPTLDGRVEVWSAPIDGSLPAVRLDPAQVDGDVESDYALTTNLVVYRGNTRNVLATELFAVPLDGTHAPRRLNGPLVANGNVESFRIAPEGSSVLYRADQELDEVLELYEATFARPTRRGALR